MKLTKRFLICAVLAAIGLGLLFASFFSSDTMQSVAAVSLILLAIGIFLAERSSETVFSWIPDFCLLASGCILELIFENPLISFLCLAFAAICFLLRLFQQIPAANIANGILLLGTAFALSPRHWFYALLAGVGAFLLGNTIVRIINDFCWKKVQKCADDYLDDLYDLYVDLPITQAIEQRIREEQKNRIVGRICLCHNSFQLEGYEDHKQFLNCQLSELDFGFSDFPNQWHIEACAKALLQKFGKAFEAIENETETAVTLVRVVIDEES